MASLTNTRTSAGADGAAAAATPAPTPAMPGAAGAKSGPVASAAPVALTAAHLVAYVLDLVGLPAHVVLRGHGPASATDVGGNRPRLTVALREPVPVAELVEVVRRFHDSTHACCLILGRYGPPQDYAERLVVGEDAAVVRIERRFRSHKDARRPDRLLGLVCREPPPAGPKAARSVLHLLRECLATAGTIDTRRVNLPAAPPVPEVDALSFLSEQERHRLAVRLKWKAVAPDCYASPNARLSERALLRGPLFIDEGVEIGPGDIHIGPAWLRPGAPAVTVAARDVHGHASKPEEASARAALSGRQYFVGPTAAAKPVYGLCKRAFDVVFGATALILMLPIMMVAAALIWLTDFGPVFFSHEREGLNGKPFGCLKFRTMVRNAEAMKEQLKQQNQVDGPQFKIAYDPRVTWIGRFLRKTNIDELPQFWNVLKGEMSVVGPRPSPFKENQLCPPWREARLSVKPGITGLWQVSRSPERGAADFQEWIFYDTQYVERRSFWLDFKIILLTVKELMGKGQ